MKGLVFLFIRQAVCALGCSHPSLCFPLSVCSSRGALFPFIPSLVSSPLSSLIYFSSCSAPAATGSPALQSRGLERGNVDERQQGKGRCLEAAGKMERFGCFFCFFFKEAKDLFGLCCISCAHMPATLYHTLIYFS